MEAKVHGKECVSTFKLRAGDAHKVFEDDHGRFVGYHRLTVYHSSKKGFKTWEEFEERCKQDFKIVESVRATFLGTNAATRVMEGIDPLPPALSKLLKDLGLDNDK